MEEKSHVEDYLRDSKFVTWLEDNEWTYYLGEFYERDFEKYKITIQ